MKKAEIIAMAVECGAELFEQQNGNDATRKYNVYIITPDEIEAFADRIAQQAIAEHIATQQESAPVLTEESIGDMCGGCGAVRESQRCIGCLHIFTPGDMGDRIQKSQKAAIAAGGAK